MFGNHEDTPHYWLLAIRERVGADTFYAAVDRLMAMEAAHIMQPIQPPLYHWLGAEADAI